MYLKGGRAPNWSGSGARSRSESGVRLPTSSSHMDVPSIRFFLHITTEFRRIHVSDSRVLSFTASWSCPAALDYSMFCDNVSDILPPTFMTVRYRGSLNFCRNLFCTQHIIFSNDRLFFGHILSKVEHSRPFSKSPPYSRVRSSFE